MYSLDVGIKEKSGRVLQIESKAKLSRTLHKIIAQDQKKRRAKITSIVSEKEKALTLSMDSYSIINEQVELTIRVSDMVNMHSVLKRASLTVTGINKKYNITQGYAYLSSLMSYN